MNHRPDIMGHKQAVWLEFSAHDASIDGEDADVYGLCRLIYRELLGMKNARNGFLTPVRYAFFCVTRVVLTVNGGAFEQNDVLGRMSKSDEPRVNNQISSATVRLVDQNGAMLGVVATQEAMRLSEQAGLDLVEISPGATPPVCKILDYGKYRYEIQKKAHEARKKQKVISIKEIKLRPTIDKHDLEIKMRNVLGFLEDGDKVRVTLRFRGREMDHQELGMQILERVQETLKEHCKIEQSPRIEGKQIVMTVAPK